MQNGFNFKNFKIFKFKFKTEIYILNIADQLDKPVDKYLKLFSPERREKILRFKFNADRNRTLWAELLTRKIIAQKAGIDFKKIIIMRDINNKPSLNPDLNLNLKFSLSHSGSWVALSIGECDNGIDVETRTEIDIKIAKRFFLEDEYKYLENLKNLKNNITDWRREFFKYWTLKESCLKCLNLREWSGVDCEKLLSGRFLYENKRVYGANFILPDGAVIGVCAAKLL